MNRDKILLDFLKSEVYEAAIKKRDYHERQAKIWLNNRAAMESVTHTTVKPSDLTNCDEQAAGHGELYDKYSVWVEFLSKATEVHVKLDYDDYAFFFG